MTEEITNVGTKGHIDWGKSPDEGVERGYVPRLVIVDSHHRVQEELERLSHIMRDKVNCPVIFVIHREEEEMRHLLKRVIVFGLMGGEFLRIRESIDTNMIIGTVIGKQKPNFHSVARNHQPHQKSQNRMNHNLPKQQFLPRGIMRDGRGHSESMKTTRSRISVRNGSR